MTVGTQQGFPTITSPFVDSRGIIQQAWYQLLIALWTRTGSAQGSQTFLTGDLKATASDTDQNGWLLCDGRAVSRTAYPVLFAVISTTWGVGDNSTTFNLPDFRGRFPLGASIAHPFASNGGAETVTITIADLPAHNHAVADPGHGHTFTGTPHTHTVNDPTHTHTLTDPGHHHSVSIGNGTGNVVAGGAGTATATISTGNATTGATIGNAATGITLANATAGGTIGNSTTGVTTLNTGNGTALPILSPFAAVNYLIKT